MVLAIVTLGVLLAATVYSIILTVRIYKSNQDSNSNAGSPPGGRL